MKRYKNKEKVVVARSKSHVVYKTKDNKFEFYNKKYKKIDTVWEDCTREEIKEHLNLMGPEWEII